MRVEKPIAERDLQAIAELSGALSRARDATSIGRALVDAVCERPPIELAVLYRVDESLGHARGVYGAAGGREIDWASEITLELQGDPSGTAAAVRERRAIVVEHAAQSAILNQGLVERTGVKSLAFVPALSGERAIGVLAIGTLSGHHAFELDELTLIQALAAEAALALERSRTEDALSDALDRERLIASIAQQVRSEMHLDSVLEVATRETSIALDLIRCFIRLGEPGGPMPMAFEWQLPGFTPIGDASNRLPVTNLAARQRRTITINDVRMADELREVDADAPETLVEIGTYASLATPIVVFDRMIGVLGLHRGETTTWTAEEIALAEAVAREVGLAIHTAEILGENRERLKQQQALLKAAQTVTSELRLETVLQRLVAELSRLLGSDAADCYFLDADRGVLRCAAVHGLDRGLVGWEASADKGLAGEALRRATAVLSEEYEQLRFEEPHPAYEGFARAIVAPMGWAGEVRGIIGVGTRDPSRVYRKRDVEAVEVFASLAGLAVRNAESFEQSTRQTQIQRGFYRIAAILSEPLEQAETLPAIAHAATEALGGDFAAVLVPGPSGFEAAGAHELPPGVEDALVLPGPALAACAEERRPLSSPAAATDERLCEALRSTAHGTFASLLALPLEHRDAGALVVVFFRNERSFSDDDLEVGRHLAQAARGALERTELYESERTANALSRQLARTGSRLAVELDPDAVIAEVVQQAPALLSADAAVLWELVGDELIGRAAAGYGASDAVGFRTPTTARPAGDVVQSSLPATVPSAADDPSAAAGDPLLGGGHRSAVGVPLVAPEGGLHGVLAVYASAPREWRVDEVQALEALAGNAASALANAELYQRVAMEKERSDAILGSIADGIVAVDREGHVVLWNAAAEQITGVPAGEAVGSTPEEVLAGRLSGEHEARTGERLVAVIRGGEDVWLSVTEAVMHDPAGAIAGRVFAFRDVSAEHTVEELKSDFVASVSHELRAPLTSIFGFAETLVAREGLFDAEERLTFLRYIAAEAERLTVIVEQLLNVARLEAGDLEVEVAPVAVVPVIEEAVAQAKRLDPDGSHRFVIDPPQHVLRADADADKLRQVLGNLLDNAMKYSPEGGTITIGARRQLDRVEIDVADEGIGIRQAEQELVFRKFYRALDSVAARGGPGAGVGLFIARGLVRAMGGSMSVSSAESVGSRFTFDLPLSRAQGEDA